MISELPIGRVKVLTINPSYPYKGLIIGRDSDFIYLDTGEYQGIMCIPFSNINYVQEVKKKEEVV